MTIHIITDSGSDILPEESKQFGITTIPLKITFNDDVFIDSVTLSHKDFYNKLIESDVLPKTSQPSPAEYTEAIDEALKVADEAVIITLSSELSGTYQSACIAASEYPDKVRVIDSENVCVGQRILVLRALQLIKEGLSLDELKERIDIEKKEIKLMAALDTLEYLKKGGRISSTAAFAGGVLNIKPVVTLEDGKIKQLGKARGSKNINNLLRKLMAECNGADFNKPYCAAYSGLSDAYIQKYIEDCSDLWRNDGHELPVKTVGCAIGTHVGPGAIVVAFFEKELTK